MVSGVGSGDLLKLRDGPGLDYNIIIGLPERTRLNRQNCLTNNGKVWCRVSLADRPGVSGYVSADYLAYLFRSRTSGLLGQGRENEIWPPCCGSHVLGFGASRRPAFFPDPQGLLRRSSMNSDAGSTPLTIR